MSSTLPSFVSDSYTMDMDAPGSVSLLMLKNVLLNLYAVFNMDAGQDVCDDRRSQPGSETGTAKYKDALESFYADMLEGFTNLG